LSNASFAVIFYAMRKFWNTVAALVIIFLLGRFSVSAAPQPSGIAGQVFLLQYSPIGAFPGDTVTTPLQITLSVYAGSASRSKHFRLVGNVKTAEDGTFYIKLPPGNYFLAANPPGDYAGTASDQLQVTVMPRKVTYDEIDFVYLGAGLFD
jgi:hypothetical protein